jgi:hypothetical protein
VQERGEDPVAQHGQGEDQAGTDQDYIPPDLVVDGSPHKVRAARALISR